MRVIISGLPSPHGSSLLVYVFNASWLSIRHPFVLA